MVGAGHLCFPHFVPGEPMLGFLFFLFTLTLWTCGFREGFGFVNSAWEVTKEPIP